MNRHDNNYSYINRNNIKTIRYRGEGGPHIHPKSSRLVDIDKEHFRTLEEFELAAARTYTNFNNILGSRPTQLFTGGGYHFLTPQHVPVLEKIEEFSKFDQPSRRFMHFKSNY